MNNNLIRIALAGCAAIGLSVPATAFAWWSGTQTYNPPSNTHSHDCSDGGTSNPNCDTWTFNNTKTDTQGGNTATATGWANTADSLTQSNVLLNSAYITKNGSSGLGVRNNDCTGYANCTGGGGDTNEGSSPEHAIDNSDRVDSILFSFTEKVNLTSFTAGWVSGDSDFSVLAFTGSGDPASLSGQSYSGLLSNGWSLVGNYYVGGNGQPSSAAGAHNFVNSIYSSYWLIGALNTFVGGDSNKAGNDNFKLISLAGCDCSTAPPGTPGCSNGVPEPGTLLLMGAGLLGLTRYSRRRLVRAA